jgi:hypothetical protein
MAATKRLHNKVSEETNSEGFSAHRTQAVDHRLTQLAALPRTHV